MSEFKAKYFRVLDKNDENYDQIFPCLETVNGYIALATPTETIYFKHDEVEDVTP